MPVLAVFLFPLLTQAQPVFPTIDHETYHLLLNTLFGSQERPDKRAIFEISIRVVPAFTPESQVNLLLLSHRTTMGEFVVADKRVASHSSEILRATGEASVETLAKKNKVRRYAVNVSPTLLMEWQRGLLESLSQTVGALDDPNAADIVTLDGVEYEVLYTLGQTAIQATVTDQRPDSALFTWAKSVYSAVAKQAPGAAQQKAN